MLVKGRLQEHLSYRYPAGLVGPPDRRPAAPSNRLARAGDRTRRSGFFYLFGPTPAPPKEGGMRRREQGAEDQLKVVGRRIKAPLIESRWEAPQVVCSMAVGGPPWNLSVQATQLSHEIFLSNMLTT